MAKASRYFTLLERMPGERWGIAFGDYTFSVVAQERDDLVENAPFDHDGAYPEYKIVRTSDDQASIDAEVAKLNAP
jgi:hypothetical protein